MDKAGQVNEILVTFIEETKNGKYGFVCKINPNRNDIPQRIEIDNYEDLIYSIE